MSFTSRNGLRFTVEILEDLGHAYVCRVIKGRKLFVGKVMTFTKTEMGR